MENCAKWYWRATIVGGSLYMAYLFSKEGAKIAVDTRMPRPAGEIFTAASAFAGAIFGGILGPLLPFTAPIYYNQRQVDGIGKWLST